MTTVINLYGGPSMGKSVLCARLYAEMALNPTFGCVEPVNEYAKLLVWQKDWETLCDQPLVTKGQIKNFAAIGQCDYIVTDSPIDLGLVYASPLTYRVTKTLIEDFKENNPHREINILLRRERDLFEKEGRVHSQEESKQKDLEIKSLLETLNKKIIEVSNMIDPRDLSRIILQNNE